MAGHPTNIIFLTCDAFGVLPPVSKLTPAQAMYHFISGYTAKVAGTEVGVTEPQATFSACFGAAFLVWHPTKYAEMLAERLRSARRAGLAGQHRLVGRSRTARARGSSWRTRARSSTRSTRGELLDVADHAKTRSSAWPIPHRGAGRARRDPAAGKHLGRSRPHIDQTAEKLASLFRPEFSPVCRRRQRRNSCRRSTAGVCRQSLNRRQSEF